MKKKFAIFAALALGFVFALTACGHTPPPPDPTPPPPENVYVAPECDDGVAAVYELDLQAKGEDKTFDAWLKDWVTEHSVDEEGNKKTATRVTTTADGDLTITFSDETTKTVIMPKVFTVHTLVRGSNLPLAGAHVRIAYDDRNFVAHFVYNDAVSDANGVATAVFAPKSNARYWVAASTVDNHTPANYKNVEYNTYFPTGSREVTFYYRSTLDSNDYFDATPIAIPYSRIHDTSATYRVTTYHEEESNDVFFTAQNYGTVVKDNDVSVSNWETNEGGKESRATLTVNYKANRVKYFVFHPYVAPQGENDAARINASKAATGIYRITVAEGGENVRLYQFNHTSARDYLDDEGVPRSDNHIDLVNSITGNAPQAGVWNESKYTGTNSIYVNVSRIIDLDGTNGDFGGFGFSAAPFYFYLRGTANATVKITVERIHDAVNDTTTEASVDSTVLAAPEGNNPWGSGTLRLMPIDGSLDAVPGADGYYHVKTETGPILMVALNQKVARVSSDALKDMPTKSDSKKGVFIFGIQQTTTQTVAGIGTFERTATKVYDYNALITAYSVAATYSNAGNLPYSGMYGVTQTMSEFLHCYNGGTAIKDAKAGYAWLAPCYYFEPAGGIPLDGEGTEASPYLLTVGANTVTFNGDTAYLRYTAGEDAAYLFTSENALTASATTLIKQGRNKYYALLKEGESIVICAAKGTGNSASLELSQISAYVPVYYTDVDGEGNVVNLTEGATAQHAYAMRTTACALQVDSGVCEEGVYVTYTLHTVGTDVYYVTLRTVGGTATVNDTPRETTVIGMKDGQSITFLVKSNDMQTVNVVMLLASVSPTGTPDVTL